MAKDKLYHSEVWLRSQYIDQSKSIKEMAAAAGCTELTIRRALKKAGIIQ